MEYRWKSRIPGTREKKKKNKPGNNGMKLVQTEKRVQEKRELTFSLAH